MLDSAQSKIIYLASSISAATGDRIFVMKKAEIVPSRTDAELAKQTGSQQAMQLLPTVWKVFLPTLHKVALKY